MGFTPVGLPGAVAEIFFIGAEDIGLEEEAKDVDFSGASGAEEDDAWGPLEEEKGFDGGDFAEDGLFDGFWEALDETFEFIVEREKEGWFHKVEGRGGGYASVAWWQVGEMRAGESAWGFMWGTC